MDRVLVLKAEMRGLFNMFKTKNKTKRIIGKIEGVPVIEITPLRIKSKEEKEGLYYYHIRHSDDDWEKPISIRKRVWVNHFGTIVTSEPIHKLESASFDKIIVDESLCEFIVSNC